MVSRGTLGQPWIVEDIIRLLSGEPPIERSFEHNRQALYNHFLHTIGYQTPKKVAIDMRRVGCWYFKKNAASRAFREKISKAESLEVVKNLILDLQMPESVECAADAKDSEECVECNG